MAWDFETDPESQALLDWADEFVRTEVEPLDYVFANPYDRSDTAAMEFTAPLKQAVKDRGLWACHLGPELGGQGFGQPGWDCSTRCWAGRFGRRRYSAVKHRIPATARFSLTTAPRNRRLGICSPSSTAISARVTR